jgi:hypothetical protein
MAASINVAQPIIPYRVVDTMGAQAAVRRFQEKAGQTFLIGTPVQIDVAGATGFLIACPAMTSVATALIAGFSLEIGHNLATSGVTPPGGAMQTAGAPQNQPSAVIIPGGAWPFDGTLPGSCGVHLAADVNDFIGTEGGSTTDADGTIAQAQFDNIYGLTKDLGNNYWYVDIDKATAATGACVQIIGFIDPIGTLHGRVIFRVTHAAAQLRA